MSKWGLGDDRWLHCRHVGVQNKRKFVHIVCIKMEVKSQRRKKLLFLYTNMAAMTSHANNQYEYKTVTKIQTLCSVGQAKAIVDQLIQTQWVSQWENQRFGAQRPRGFWRVLKFYASEREPDQTRQLMKERHRERRKDKQTERERRDGARYKEMLNCTATSLGIIGLPVK